MNSIFPELRAKPAIAVNHVGYPVDAAKHAVISIANTPPFDAIHLCRDDGMRLDGLALLSPVETVSGWTGLRFQKVDFSDASEQGKFFLLATRSDGSELRSDIFEVSPDAGNSEIASLICDYFESQRCVGDYEEADRSIRFFGNQDRGTVDVHGGWYDASGDVSKYLSHLSYANYMNPQQTPLVVWSLARASQHGDFDPVLRQRFNEECCYGADFLVRMCDPSGAFYMTVFDTWSGDLDQREICSYATQKGHKYDDWQAGYRQGGGMAIAALAKAARLKVTGKFTAETYLQTALRGFEHLEKYNVSYLDDGQENIIDDYTALLAATELYNATQVAKFQSVASKRAERLMGRVSTGYGYDGWLRADDVGARPFFHASDAGLPFVALAQYREIAPEDDRLKIDAFFLKVLKHQLSINDEVANPFGYPRQLVTRSDGQIATQFFFPHGNESGYWWQGENARLASLATAFYTMAKSLPSDRATAAGDQAQRMLDWVLGANPYHSCMLQGVGRNHADYNLAKIPNADGGICNGITSALEDERDITFCQTEDLLQSWRWGEQWLPHSAWFLLALCARS